MHFFEINNIAFNGLGYPVSFVELIGTFFGLISVYYATRANILTWATGILNEVFLFILFYQVQLYADMFLQVYFLIITLYGWYNWNKKSIENKIINLNIRIKLLILAIIIICSLISGIIFTKIHLYLPTFFKIQAAYPFVDSFVMVSSVIATVLLAKKKIENWYLWITVNVICVILYYKKGIYFLSLEYFIFLGLACYGFCNWKKQLIYE